MRTILSKMPDWSQYMKGQQTLEIGYPWLALGAILALERIVQPSWRVLEFGSGGSTLFWARRCKSVDSYETEAAWALKVNDAVKGIGRASVFHYPDVDVLCREVAAGESGWADLLVIDHDDPARRAIGRNANRLPLALAALHTVKPGGWVLVDNYDSFGMKGFDWTQFPLVFTFDEPGGLALRTRRYSGRGTRLGQTRAA